MILGLAGEGMVAAKGPESDLANFNEF